MAAIAARGTPLLLGPCCRGSGFRLWLDEFRAVDRRIVLESHSSHHGRGTCIEKSTTTPSIGLNQCGVFSGTRIQSPLATFRGVPPSIAEPLRFVASVRFSFASLPRLPKATDPSLP